jgi:hypothetical protein
MGTVKTFSVFSCMWIGSRSPAVIRSEMHMDLQVRLIIYDF